jgi:hypothetical protein
LRFLGCLWGNSWERLGPPGGLQGGGARQEKKETKKDKESNKKERKSKQKTTQKETPEGQNLMGKEQNHEKPEETENLRKRKRGCKKVRPKQYRQPPLVLGSVTEPVEEKEGGSQNWGETSLPKRPPKS